MWYKFAQNHPYVEKAIERFNITKDPNKAGYVLSDGRMLDFSDGYDTRDLTHDTVFEIMPVANDPVEGYTNFHKQYVVPFMHSTNSIRISKDGENLSVEIHTIPSDEQIIAIAKSLDKGDNFFYEIDLFGNGKSISGQKLNTNQSYVGQLLREFKSSMQSYK